MDKMEELMAVENEIVKAENSNLVNGLIVAGAVGAFYATSVLTHKYIGRPLANKAKKVFVKIRSKKNQQEELDQQTIDLFEKREVEVEAE